MVKLLVFAHKPPPHHGQSYMVQLLIDSLGGDRRRAQKLAAPERLSLPKNQTNHPIECFHVDCRVSEDTQDIGRIRLGKACRIFKYCVEAIWCRFRHGASCLYYVPAPGVRSAVYRDWIVMALCRPFFRKIILHWHAVGLGAWLETDAKPFERWVTRRLLSNSDLSIVLGSFYRADVAKLVPKRIEAVPNGIPDHCPGFEQDVLPRRRARSAARQRLMAGQSPSKTDMEHGGNDPQIFRVLFLSLCTREKGIFDALEAVAFGNKMLSDARSPIRLHLTIAGKFWHAREKTEFDERLAQADLIDASARTA